MSEELKIKVRDHLKVLYELMDLAPMECGGDSAELLEDCLDYLQALEAKANAFDALEWLVKECPFVQISENFDALFSVVWTVSTTRGAGDIGQGPDLQSAINDACMAGEVSSDDTKNKVHVRHWFCWMQARRSYRVG